MQYAPGPGILPCVGEMVAPLLLVSLVMVAFLSWVYGDRSTLTGALASSSVGICAH